MLCLDRGSAPDSAPCRVSGPRVCRLRLLWVSWCWVQFWVPGGPCWVCWVLSGGRSLRLARESTQGSARCLALGPRVCRLRLPWGLWCWVQCWVLGAGCSVVGACCASTGDQPRTRRFARCLVRGSAACASSGCCVAGSSSGSRLVPSGLAGDVLVVVATCCAWPGDLPRTRCVAWRLDRGSAACASHGIGALAPVLGSRRFLLGWLGV